MKSKVKQLQADSNPRAEDTGPAVENGVLRYVSVSQIQTFDVNTFGGCNRKWYAEKVMKVPREETQAQHTGKQIHAEIEHYLKTGEDVLSVIPRQGKHFLPDRRHSDKWLIEHPLHGKPVFVAEDKPLKVELTYLFDEWRTICARVEAGGNDGADVFEAQQWYSLNLAEKVKESLIVGDTNVPVVGFIDLVNMSGYWMNNEGEELKDVADIELVDWKTSSSIEKYSKSAADLGKSVQMIGYAKWASIVEPSLQTFRLSHGNFQTRGRGSELRSTVIALDSVEKEWQATISTVRAMKDVAREPTIDKVEPNFEACEAYRGCPHRGICPKSGEQRLLQIFGKVPTSLLRTPPTTQPPAQQPVSAIESLVAGWMSSRVTAPTSTKKGTTTMGMFDRMMGKAPEPPPPETPPVAPAQTPAAPGASTAVQVAAEKAKLQAEEAQLRGGGPLAPIVNCGACGITCTPQNSSTLTNGQVQHIGCPKMPAQVLPPDAPASDFAKSAQRVPDESMGILPPEIRARAVAHAAAVDAAKPDTVTTKVEATELDSTPAGGTVTEEKGRKCGVCGKTGHNARSCYEKKTAAPGDSAAQTGIPLLTHKAEEAPASTAVATAATSAAALPGGVQAGGPGMNNTEVSQGICIYVDCYVEGITTTPLDAYIADKCKQLAAAARLEDIRFADQANALGFNKWRGALAAAVEADLPPPGNYSLMFVREDDFKQVAFAALKGHCALVVRGVGAS